MSATRRQFLGAGAAALLGSAAAAGEGAAMSCLDYSRCFICGTSPVNSLRLWVESRTTVFDDRQGTTTEYYQCASCKSEDTFAERNLFYPDNYDFLPIYGDRKWLIFRRHARITPGYRRIQVLEEVWGIPELKLARAAAARPLDSWEAIREATAAAVPIVAQTELTSEETGLRAVIECPVKTINISLEKRMYQVDTGPVAFPDLSRRYDEPIDCLSLAFIAFNAADFADFVIEQPTPVIEDGLEKCRILHYSSPVSHRARNILLAIEA